MTISGKYGFASRRAERDEVGREVVDRLFQAQEEASAAASGAEEGEGGAADERLSSVIAILEEILADLASERQGGYSDESVATLRPRVQAGIVRAEEAIETELA